jgi:hypothetical protein
MKHGSASSAGNAAAELYLDLLKRSLTNTVFDAEPDIDDDEFRFTMQRVAHYVNTSAVSMIPLARFDNIRECVESILEDGVPGDLIETGVWRGGAVIFMRALLKLHGVTDRLVWGADSFEGLPEPDPEKYPLEAKVQGGPVIQKAYHNLAVSLEETQRNLSAYGMLDDQVRLLKGWFCDTLPNASIAQLALIRVDGDFYESTRDALVSLYDKLSVGGYVIIDDYGEDSWTYCRKAVDEFRAVRGISDPIIPVDSKCVYWRRSAPDHTPRPAVP